ncbi:hypothetical protein GIB67_012172 [Kingdonia uniflora]|uniref:DNA-directed RNA polymerase n=1 Tax=Kingdonia uniflora TaxID=39325 RepID=A0A7J7NP75_9MAGN|nr:hypothetical protein GIB67_012172 [Kingdonia uniflora]
MGNDARGREQERGKEGQEQFEKNRRKRYLLEKKSQGKCIGEIYTQIAQQEQSKSNFQEVLQLNLLRGHNFITICAMNQVKVHRFLEKTKTKTKTKTGKRKKEQEVEPNVVTSEQIRLRKKVEHLIKKQKIQQVRMALKSQDDPKAWGRDARIRVCDSTIASDKVGGNLISFLVETAYIQPPINQMAENSPDIRPAFRHYINSAKASKIFLSLSVNRKGAKKCGIIECDPLILKGLEKSAKHLVMQYKPMLVPPVKWTQYDKGAYLFLPSFVMRTHGAKQQREALKRSPQKQLTPVYEALDTLGSTKWRINRRVFRVVESIWASGGSLADMVDRDDVPVPVKPDTEDEAELKKWKWKASAAKKENRQRHSQRCDVELKLDVARKIKDEDGFFFPHNLDFRGRAYPMHPHLNHLGSDMCRGVLEFGEGRPLGKMGLRWLKIHLANLYAGGVDKLSHDGRISFTESHLDDIFDSADKPLEGMRWWLNAEDPFQCLAACINISDALRSPSPESTISHMPVHQDGSCNGLQHYAALGRDKLGAATVNLVDAEKPADVYSGIAARVLDIMRKDAQNDPETDQNALRARILINEVDRKLVKQTVMTSVYGVTYIGARDQIKKRLKERPAIADNEELFGAACYAAKVSFKI